MIKLFLTCLVVLSFQSVYALDLLSYKNTGSSVTVLSESAVNTTWNSNTPTCLKEGGRILGVNKAYKAKRLKYADCSTSDKRKRIHEAQGIEVVVFKLGELPMSMIKTIKAKK